MKIQQSQIKLPGHLLSNDLLKNLRQNSKINVNIIKVINKNHAVLDIGGYRLKAEFQQGVPDSDKLQLVLLREINNTYYFKISDSGDNSGIDEILKFTVFNSDDFDKSTLYDLKSELKNIHSIFALNTALLKLSGFSDKNSSKKISDIFNLLLSKGAKYDTLVLLSRLISVKDTSSQQILNILSKIFPEFNSLTDAVINSFNSKKIEDKISDFLSSIENNLSKKESTELIRNILDLMIFENQKDITYGNIIYSDNNEFKLCKYIVNGNSIFLSLSLTELGEIDIIIKDDKSVYSITFCCKEKAACEFLKKNVTELQSMIKRYNKKYVHILFHNKALVIEKIVEIISSMDFNYLLDIKV